MQSKGKTRYVILGLLNENPMSGYDLKKIIDLRFKYFWNESFGQIYPGLEKLVKEKLVTKAIDRENKKKRSVYSITEKGKSELLKWLSRPVDTELMRFEILLKVYFGNLLEKTDLDKHISAFRSKHTQNLEIIKQFEEELLSIRDMHDNHEYVLKVILFGKMVYETFIKWSDSYKSET